MKKIITLLSLIAGMQTALAQINKTVITKAELATIKTP